MKECLVNIVTANAISVTVGDWFLRPGRTETGMSSYWSPNISFSCVHMGPAWKWTQTGLTSSRSLTRRELLSYRTETLPFSWKKGNESRTGSTNSMFICMAPSFLLILLITSVSKTSKLNLFYWSRPAQGNPRQSWILASTLWIPDLSVELGFWIPVVSGIPDFFT